jgi:hypothetical protein
MGSIEVPFCKSHLAMLGNPQTLEELCVAVYDCETGMQHASLYAHYSNMEDLGYEGMSGFKIPARDAYVKFRGYKGYKEVSF